MAAATSDFVGVKGEREILSSRTFAAPRARVWEAWLDPVQLSQWWGPDGFTTTTLELDLRVGGMWRFVMHGPDGANYPSECEFTEVVPMERVSVRMTGGKDDGRRVQMERTMTWEEVDGGTRMSIHMTFPTQDERDFVVAVHGALRGSEQMHERLAKLLANER